MRDGEGAPTTAFAALLKRYRTRAGLAQDALAERAGLSREAISLLERGRRRPFPDTVRRLADALRLAQAEREAFVAHASASPPALAPAETRGDGWRSPPQALTPLIGREALVATVVAQVGVAEGTARLVTLIGPGGVGKTRLAQAVAARAEAGAVCWVDLAPLAGPDLLLPTVARAVGLHEDASVQSGTLLERLMAVLRGRRLLLVLDNFEHLTEAAPVVNALLAAAPRLTVLVTSRVVLRLTGEHEVWVPPLALPDHEQVPSVEHLVTYDAVRLFVARAQAVKADFRVSVENAPVVAAICQRLDGLPLAIELAVARLRLLSPQALLARLEHRLPLLTGGARDLPARQQTLANTIAWSYDLLEPHEQVLFRRLGVFTGGCTLEAAEAVCGEQGTQDSPLLNGVESLVAKSLLRQQEQPDGDVRCAMLETLREFATEQLQRHGEADTVQQRHLDYFLPWTVEACRHVHWADQLEWLVRLDREEGNLRAVLGWCVQRGQGGDLQATEAGLQLAGALGHWYWAIHARSVEGLAWLERLLSLPGAATRSAGRARALLAAGLLTLWSGWFPRGGTTPTWALYEEALAIAQELEDKGIAAMACMGLGFSLPDRAGQRAHREDALRLYREVGDAWGIAFGLWAVGEYHADLGDLATAQTFLEQSISANAGVGDRSTGSNAQQALAQVALKCGDFARAQALLKQSLQPLRELHHQRSIGLTFNRLAVVALLAGERAVAQGYYCQALQIFLASGDSSASAEALTGLAVLALHEGAPVRAVRLAGALHVRAKPAKSNVIGDWWQAPDALQIREAATRVVSEEDVAQSWAEGQAMTLEQAIAYALTEYAHRHES